MAINSFHKHFHQRHKKKPKKEPIDKLIYVAVFAGPIFTIPQVYAVWFEESSGVSAVSWMAYAAIAVVWLIYGIRHRDLPIIVSQILWLIMDLLICIGLLYAQ